MEDQTQNEEENLSLMDTVVLTVGLGATLIGLGLVARIGWEIADEGIAKFKNWRTARKTEEK